MKKIWFLVFLLLPGIGLAQSPGIRVLSPNGGEQWMIEDPQTIRWAIGDASVERVYIYFLSQGPDGTWTPTSGIGSSGTQHSSFTIYPANIQAGEARVRVSNNPNEKKGTCLDPSVPDPNVDCPPPRRFQYLSGDSNLPFTIQGAGRIVVSRPESSPRHIVPGVGSQVIGSFDVDVSGEETTVQQITFGFLLKGSPATLRDLTNIRLADSERGQITGPASATDTGTAGSVTFTDPFAMPLGKSTWDIVADVGENFAVGQSISSYLDPIVHILKPAGATSHKPMVTRPNGSVFGRDVSVSRKTPAGVESPE